MRSGSCHCTAQTRNDDGKRGRAQAELVQSTQAISDLETSRLGGLPQGPPLPASLLQQATPVYHAVFAHKPLDNRFQAALIFFAPCINRLAVDVENSDGNSPLAHRQDKRYDNLGLGRTVTCYVPRDGMHILDNDSAGGRVSKGGTFGSERGTHVFRDKMALAQTPFRLSVSGIFKQPGRPWYGPMTRLGGRSGMPWSGRLSPLLADGEARDRG